METITKQSETEIVITTTEVKEEVYSKDLILTKITERMALIAETEADKAIWVARLEKAEELEVKTQEELAVTTEEVLKETEEPVVE